MSRQQGVNRKRRLLLATGAVLVGGCQADWFSRTAESARIEALSWLEEAHGERALAWVAAQNQRTVAAFGQGDAFSQRQAALAASMPIPPPMLAQTRFGAYLYELLRDQTHPCGLWRRTPIRQYEAGTPQWEAVLDLDALSRAEGVTWSLTGSDVLEPDYTVALLSLSPDGQDAFEVREFDLVQRRFVADGFHVPPGKTSLCWINRDTLLVAANSGPGSLTASGYPRLVKHWHRGGALAQAETVLAADVRSSGVAVSRDTTAGTTRFVITRLLGAHRIEYFLLETEGAPIPLVTPTDAILRFHRQHLFVTLASTWEVAGQRYTAGSLLTMPLAAFLAGGRTFTVLFVPDQRQVLGEIVLTRDHLFLSYMEDVAGRVQAFAFSPAEQAWQRKDLAAPEGLLSLIVEGKGDDSNDFTLYASSFLQPTSYYRGNLAQGSGVEEFAQQRALFDATGLELTQHFALSADGTRIPYFQVDARGAVGQRARPTLLYGYGGFGVSLTPQYLDGMTAAWLAQGGVYVVANIRGGGEYGPRWHQTALREGRHRAYEDFAAVAQDLVKRGVTTPSRLGAYGQSNGGLLTGNMLVHYPQLFACLVSDVPLMDMRRYSHLAAGASWVDEYGDPDVPQDWAFLQRYSPLHQVRTGLTYPPLLLTTATNDDRSHPAHARKMAAHMQQLGYPQVYLHESTAGGHDGSMAVEQRASYAALVLAFLNRYLMNAG